MLFSLEPLGDGLYSVSTPHKRVLVIGSVPEFTALLVDQDVVLLRESVADILFSIGDNPNITSVEGFTGEIFWETENAAFRMTIDNSDVVVEPISEVPHSIFYLPEPSSLVTFENGYVRIHEPAQNLPVSFSLSNYKVRAGFSVPALSELNSEFIIEFHYCPTEIDSPIFTNSLDEFEPGVLGYTIPVQALPGIFKVEPSQFIVAAVIDYLKLPMTKYS